MLYSVLAFFIFFLLLEVFSYFFISIGLLNSRKITNQDLEIYKKLKQTSNNFVYDNSIENILPLPNKVLYYQYTEYTDIFHTSEIGGIGTYDNGLKNKKNIILALGDSFTRGVGAQNIIKNHWLEKTEASLEETEILNFGNAGSEARGGIQFYNKIKNRIPHSAVLYNVFTKRDIIDHITDNESLSEFIFQNFSPEMRSDAIRKYALGQVYRIEKEFYKYKTLSLSSTLKLFIFLYQSHISRFPPYSELGQFYKDFSRKYGAYQKKKRPKIFSHIKENLGTERIDMFGDSKYPLNHRFFVEKWMWGRENRKEVNFVTKELVSHLNNFNKQLKREGKKLIVSLHPGKDQVYLYRDSRFLKRYDFDFIQHEIMKNLDDDIDVIDLTNEVRDVAKNNPNKYIYYEMDGHYCPYGHEKVAKIMKKKLNEIGFD